MKTSFKAKTILLLIIIPIITILSGCNINLPLSKQLIIKAIAIDINNSGFVVTMQVLDFENLEKETPAIKTVTAEGGGVWAALESAKKQTGLEPIYSQNLLIIVSEDAAKLGFNTFIDFFVRHYGTKKNVKLCVSKCKATEILNVKNGKTLTEAQIISKFINDEIGSDLMNFIKLMERDYCDPLAVVLNTKEEKNNKDTSKSEEKDGNLLGEENSEESSKKNTQENSKKDDETQKKQIILDGIAVFNSDKLAGFMTDEETIGTFLVKAVQTDYVFVLDIENVGKVSCKINKLSSKISANINENGPEFTIKINADASAYEANKISDNKTLQNEIKTKIEQKLTETIIDYVQKAIAKTLELKSDIFCLGKILLHHDSLYFKGIPNWKDTMNSSKFFYEPKINLNIVGTSLIL